MLQFFSMNSIGQPVQQFRMCGRLAAPTEIGDRGNQCLSEMAQPHVVDGYAGRERVVLTSNPARQGQTPASAGFGDRVCPAEYSFLSIVPELPPPPLVVCGRQLSFSPWPSQPSRRPVWLLRASVNFCCARNRFCFPFRRWPGVPPCGLLAPKLRHSGSGGLAYLALSAVMRASSAGRLARAEARSFLGHGHGRFCLPQGHLRILLRQLVDPFSDQGDLLFRQRSLPEGHSVVSFLLANIGSMDSLRSFSGLQQDR